MIELTVSGMTCDGCAKAVTRSIQKVDPGANVAVNLNEGKVDVNTRLSANELSVIISQAGFQVTKTNES